MKNAAIVSLLIFASCASLTEQGARVKLVGRESIKTLNGCKKLTVVESTPGGTMGGAKRDSLLIKLKNLTAEKGGNVVLSSGQLKEGTFQTFSNHMKGVAISCPEKIYSQLMDLSEL